jgi:hypothetical protein
MKLWSALAAALLAGCAASPAAPRSPEPSAPQGRDYADRLRVDTDYRPAPTGGECVTCWYELPRGAYIAQGWACCSVYPACGHGGGLFWSRRRDSSCEPWPPCGPRPYWGRRPCAWPLY